VFGNKKALPQKSGTQNLEIIEGNCFNLDTRAYNDLQIGMENTIHTKQ